MVDQDPREVIIPIDRPQVGIMAGMPPADVVRAHMAALNQLTDAVNRLAAAFRTTLDQVRYEAYGQGRDDEAANLDLRYTNPRSKP